MTKPMSTLPGFQYLPQYFSAQEQAALLNAVLKAAADAPFYQPVMPRTGKPLSVWMTNLGPLGWMTDKDGGYRYEPRHPQTGQPWPAMPQALLDLWDATADYPAPPQACLVNYYAPGAKMGLHKDWDEEATDAAVVSVSLGDEALFRMGGPTRAGGTTGIRLRSGDVVVLGGAARACYHGVSRIYPATSRLWEAVAPDTLEAAQAPSVAAPASAADGLLCDAAPPQPVGRINLTLRRVTPPEA